VAVREGGEGRKRAEGLCEGLRHGGRVRGYPSAWTEEFFAVPRFPSEAWITAFCAQVSSHPAVDDAVAALSGTYRFVIEPQGPVTTPHRYAIVLREAGDGPAAVPADPDADGVRLEIAAGYERWRDLLTGRLDLMRAMLWRRIRVGGDVAGLLRSREAARPLLDALRATESEFPS